MAETYSARSKPVLLARLQGLEKKVIAELKSQGFVEDRITTERYLNMR